MKFCAALKTVLLGLISSRLLILLAWGSISSLTQAHDIPSRVTVYAFVKPEGNELTVLLRVPMEALGEVSFPLRGPGFLQFSAQLLPNFQRLRQQEAVPFRRIVRRILCSVHCAQNISRKQSRRSSSH